MARWTDKFTAQAYVFPYISLYFPQEFIPMLGIPFLFYLTNNWPFFAKWIDLSLFYKNKPLFEKSEQFYDHSPPSVSEALIRRWWSDHFAFDVQTESVQHLTGLCSTAEETVRLIFWGGWTSSQIIFKTSVVSSSGQCPCRQLCTETVCPLSNERIPPVALLCEECDCKVWRGTPSTSPTPVTLFQL